MRVNVTIYVDPQRIFTSHLSSGGFIMKYFLMRSCFSKLVRPAFVCVAIFFCAQNLPANTKWYNGSFWVLDIDQDTTLSSHWVGVVRILADGVDFNMDGYSIIGPNSNVGIYVSGRRDVNIIGDHGTIDDCNTGIYFEGGGSNSVYDVSFYCDSWGIRADNSNQLDISHCYSVSEDYFDGYLLINSDHSNIYSSYGLSCVRSGIWLDGSDDVSIQYCQFLGNHYDGITVYDCEDVYVNSGFIETNGGSLYRHGIGLFNSDNIILTNNNSQANGCYGYYRENTTNITYVNNFARYNGCGEKNF